MRISFKFRHLLSLSVLNELLHRPHFRFKCWRESRRWSKFGVTIYKVYHWHKGKFWLSYYALFSGEGERVGYSKSAVGYAMTLDDLDYELFEILWKYGNFMDFLQDIYDNDFTEDDIPQDLELDIPF